MTRLRGLPPLREVIAAHGLAPRRGLGQNFLLDPAICARIAAAAGDLSGTHVVEVGPGPGGLTRALLEAGARHVTAVEMDSRAVGALVGLVEAAEGRLTVVEGDAGALDLAALAPGPRAVVANLPYNVGTELLIGWLRQHGAWRSLTLLFQREVAARITAAPGTRAYGRLSVLAQWLCEARRALDLPPGAFWPAPKVYSRLVHLAPRTLPEGAPPVEAVEALTARAFGQRRKMLRRTLPDCLEALEALGIALERRAETLTVEQFVALAGYLENDNSKSPRGKPHGITLSQAPLARRDS